MSASHSIRLGFARGIAPSKWADRFAAAFPERRLELVPVDTAYGRGGASRDDVDRAHVNDTETVEFETVDVMLERTLPGRSPEGVDQGSRRAIGLYVETIALVVPAEHELAEVGSIEVSEVSLVTLIDHPWHAPEWPAAEPWVDPVHMPQRLTGALALVSTGLGGVLAPRTLARHLGNKREQTIVTLTGEPILPGTTVWATWDADHDSAHLQDLIGVLRGRTARSSRGGTPDSTPQASASKAHGSKPRTQTRKATPSKLDPKSRGAQLAQAQERARRAKRDRKRK